MKSKRFSLPVKICLIAGLLIQSATLILSAYFSISDAERCFMQGFGLGLMMVGLFKSRLENRNTTDLKH